MGSRRKSQLLTCISLFMALPALAAVAWPGCGDSAGGPAADVQDASVQDEKKEDGPGITVDLEPEGTAAETSGPCPATVPEVTGVVSGLVRDENGLPVEGAVIKVLDASGGPEPLPPVQSDAFGAFQTGETLLCSSLVRVESPGRMPVLARNLTTSGHVSLTLPPADGATELEVELPEPPVLEAARAGADVTLSWTATPGAEFHAYRVMRLKSAGVSLLSANVGVFIDPAVTTMTDRNLPEGTFSYRVYLDVKTPDGHFQTGSNEVSVQMPVAEAMPDKHAFVMMKTGFDKDVGMTNTAYFVVAPTDISADIGAGKKIFVTTPVLNNEKKTAMYIGKAMTKYKGNKSYCYGYPATCVGQTRKLDEWDTKYAVTAKEWANEAKVGSHLFDIDGNEVKFETPDPMPDSRVENVQLTRDKDGVLTVTWDMIVDGAPFDGGPGDMGWKYLVKILYPGIYQSGTDPVFEAEKAWSNFDIFDKDCNIGFSRVCEVAANMPQDIASIKVPDGIFKPGDTVHVLVYAISTKESFISPASGAPGYGKAFMYWLFNYKVMVKVP